MNARTPFTSTALLLIALGSGGAFAAEPPTRMSIFVDCAHPTLPSQREVGELLGLQNFRQVYARRVSLMGEIHQACRLSQAESLNLVFETPDKIQIQDGLVANSTLATR